MVREIITGFPTLAEAINSDHHVDQELDDLIRTAMDDAIDRLIKDRHPEIE